MRIHCIPLLLVLALGGLLAPDARSGLWVIGDNDFGHSADNGATWEWALADSQPSGGKDVFFYNSTHGWAVSGSTVYRTADGGATWHASDSGVNDLRSIHFVSETTGWAVGLGLGGMIVKSTDGGVTWATNYTYPYMFRFNSVFFTNQTNGWAVGERGFIVHTVNGGLTWTIAHQPNVDYGTFKDVFFVDTMHGWIADEYSAVLRTTNGGQTWNDVFVPHNPNAVYFIDASSGWASSSNGFVYRTHDGGLTWAEASCGITGNASLFFLDSQHGWAASGFGVYHTSDGGVTWNQDPTTWQSLLLSICGGGGGTPATACGPVCDSTVLVCPDGTGDYPTIQAVLDALPYGASCCIELSNGVFQNDGSSYQMNNCVTIRSRSGDPDSCIIDGNDGYFIIRQEFSSNIRNARATGNPITT
jgi:photosystem II stability/assembly factor-like uncharacterized protein